MPVLTSSLAATAALDQTSTQLSKVDHADTVGAEDAAASPSVGANVQSVSIAVQSAPAAAPQSGGQESVAGWKCDGCLAANARDAAKCLACSLPRTGSSVSVSSESDVAGLKASASALVPSFKLGTPSSTFGAGNFGFASSSFASAATHNPFATFAVAATASASPSAPNAFGGFSGSAFAMHSAAGKSEGDGDEGDANDDTDSGGAFEEAATLDSAADQGAVSAVLADAVKDAKSEGTGEEHDVVVVKFRCKLFTVTRQGDDGGKFDVVDTGTGELHVNSFDAGGQKKHRLILRQEKTNKLLLNSLLHAQIKVSRENNIIRFNTISPDFQILSYIFRVRCSMCCSRLVI